MKKKHFALISWEVTEQLYSPPNFFICATEYCFSFILPFIDYFFWFYFSISTLSTTSSPTPHPMSVCVNRVVAERRSPSDLWMCCLHTLTHTSPLPKVPHVSSSTPPPKGQLMPTLQLPPPPLVLLHTHTHTQPSGCNLLTVVS